MDLNNGVLGVGGEDFEYQGNFLCSDELLRDQGDFFRDFTFLSIYRSDFLSFLIALLNISVVFLRSRLFLFHLALFLPRSRSHFLIF